MRKLIPLLFATALFSVGAYAVEPQPLDSSTNPNTNTDLKTQNMQQKPDKHMRDKHDDHDKGYRQPKSGKRSGSDNTDRNSYDSESAPAPSGDMTH